MLVHDGLHSTTTKDRSQELTKNEHQQMFITKTVGNDFLSYYPTHVELKKLK